MWTQVPSLPSILQSYSFRKRLSNRVSDTGRKLSSGSHGAKALAVRRPFGRVVTRRDATRRALGTTSREKERDRAELFAAGRGPAPAWSRKPRTADRWNIINDDTAISHHKRGIHRRRPRKRNRESERERETLWNKKIKKERKNQTRCLSRNSNALLINASTYLLVRASRK